MAATDLRVAANVAEPTPLRHRTTTPQTTTGSLTTYPGLEWAVSRHAQVLYDRIKCSNSIAYFWTTYKDSPREEPTPFAPQDNNTADHNRQFNDLPRSEQTQPAAEHASASQQPAQQHLRRRRRSLCSGPKRAASEHRHRAQTTQNKQCRRRQRRLHQPAPRRELVRVARRAGRRRSSSRRH